MRDLHCHLSGSTNPIVLYELIRESGYKFKAKDYWDFENQVLMDRRGAHDLNSYLNILHTIDKVQSSPIAIEASVYDAFRSAYMAGAEYLELRWNPTKRSQDGNIDLDTLIVSARAGMERAGMTFGITGGMILCLGRDVTHEANEAIFNKALKYHKKGVIGIDIAGPYFKPDIPYVTDFENFIRKKHEEYKFDVYFREAKDRGMLTTIHCGEENHAAVVEEMRYVLSTLSPHRIGHGVQMYKYPELMEIARQSGVQLEICISSNLTTGAIKSKEEFKEVFTALQNAGVLYSVNTDATYLLRTDIKKENRLYRSIVDIRVEGN
jgi:adenosine deaminase